MRSISAVGPKEFFAEAIEVPGVLNFVPGRKQLNLQSYSRGPCGRVALDVRGIRRYSLKEIAMRFFEANQVIATATKGAENHKVACTRERLDGHLKYRMRHSRTIGIDQAHRGKSSAQKILNGV